MSSKNIKKMLSSIKPEIDIKDLIDTSTWIISDEKVRKNNDKIPIIESLEKISLFEAIYVMALNNIKVVKDKNNLNILESLKNVNLNNLIIPSTSKLVSKEKFKIYFVNCHELINEKSYVLNLNSTDNFPELINTKNKYDKIINMSGGRSTNLGEVHAIVNTLKINNMHGGQSFYSNPKETQNLVKSIERNFNFNTSQKERLNKLLAKHHNYTKKLNKLNESLKEFNKLTILDKNSINSNIVSENIENLKTKTKTNNNNIIEFIENSLNSEDNKVNKNIRRRNLREFPFYHLDDIIMKKFYKAEDQQKSKMIVSNIDALVEIERKVNELSDTVDSIETNM